jgi:outer membrane lipoprotein SlyB
MKKSSVWFSSVGVFAASLMVLFTCYSAQAFQVTEQAAPRTGTVESIIQDTVQGGNSTVGTVGGALVGGGVGSLFGSGRGQTATTVIGAAGGAAAGNRMASGRTTMVWRILVRYDDGSSALIEQSTAPALRIGDRVRVSATGIELMR